MVHRLRVQWRPLILIFLTCIFLFKYVTVPPKTLHVTNVEEGHYKRFRRDADELRKDLKRHLKVNNYFNVFNSSRTSVQEEYDGKCISGHILNMPPICGGDGCLDVVAHTGSVFELNLPKETREEILSLIPGMHPIHLDLMVEITKIQSLNGIVGSVGAIGPYNGKMSVILPYVIQQKLGERLFLCDMFYESIENVNLHGIIKTGFSVNSFNESYQIRIFEDESFLLSKAVFMQMDLPAFRLFLFSKTSQNEYIFHDIRQMACVIRSGGVIVIDYANKAEYEEIAKALRQFVKSYGAGIILPLIYVEGKLYLCALEYYGKYVEYFERVKDEQFKLVKVTNELFGVTFTYLSQNKK